jgi:putative PIN family toxin of toxin-antitoxin system
MLKVVLDTNIYVSALLKRGGKPDQILRLIEKYQLYCTEEILEETHRVLHYPRLRRKYKVTEREIAEHLIYLRSIATIVTSLPEVSVIKGEPVDNVILACAEVARADFIVSGDEHLKKLDSYQGIKIISPAEFLKMLK